MRRGRLPSATAPHPTPGGRTLAPLEPTPLAGRCALVTGAARRVGAVLARRLHEAGADVAIHYRGSEREAREVAAGLEAERPGSAAVFRADLARLDEIGRLVEAVMAWSGRLDVLVNNASTFYPTPLGTITAAHWDDLVGSNLKAPLFLSQAAWPHLRATGGAIVNMVDIHARRPLRDHSVYGAAKAGLAMLTRALAKEMAPQVRVNGIAPGAILWPSGMTESVKRDILEQVPLGRPGEPDDLADALLWLVTRARYVTGQVIPVDGGRSLGW